MLFWHSHLGENPQKRDQTCKSIVIKIMSEEETVSGHTWAAVKRSEIIRKEQQWSVMDSYGICLSRYVRHSHLISKHCNGPGCWNTSLDMVGFVCVLCFVLCGGVCFFFFFLSYPKFLAIDKEHDLIVSPKSEGIIVLIHTAYVASRIFSVFAVAF